MAFDLCPQTKRLILRADAPRLQRFVQWIFMSFDLEMIKAEIRADITAPAAVLGKSGVDKVGSGICQSKARVEAAASTLYRVMRNVFEGRHEIS